ncbi:hypothetical protein EV360DRAFT_67511 [Lentinula raphanica]|nr:hypothetical protein EV360DRAFT_67511 [Lentinula raphanica]
MYLLQETRAEYAFCQARYKQELSSSRVIAQPSASSFPVNIIVVPPHGELYSKNSGAVLLPTSEFESKLRTAPKHEYAFLYISVYNCLFLELEMASKDSNPSAIPKFEAVATPPWRNNPHNASPKDRSNSSVTWAHYETVLPDPTHISPFAYPATPLSRHRKRHKQKSHNSGESCTLEPKSLVQSTSQIITMGWSFRMQLQDLDKQHNMYSSEEEDETERPDPYSNKSSVTSAREAGTRSSSRPSTHPHLSASSGSPHSARLISRPQRSMNETRQGNHVDHSYTRAQPDTARLARAYTKQVKELQTTTDVWRQDQCESENYVGFMFIIAYIFLIHLNHTRIPASGHCTNRDTTMCSWAIEVLNLTPVAIPSWEEILRSRRSSRSLLSHESNFD